jgi:hypothetical protein
MTKKSTKLTDEGLHNLVGFIETFIEIDQAQKALQARLKDEPKGFSIVGEGTRCSLCERHFYEEMWYDKWGGKCFDCQDAVDKRVVPGSICRDIRNEKHILATDLSQKYDIHYQTIKKLARQGKIKPRAFKGQHGEVWVFLRKENPKLGEVIQQAIKTKDSGKRSKETSHGKVIVKEVNQARRGSSIRSASPLTL